MRYLACQNCIWSEHFGPGLVTCKRRAPNPNFPVMGATNWCGEFKPLTRSGPLAGFIAALKRPATQPDAITA